MKVWGLNRKTRERLDKVCSLSKVEIEEVKKEGRTYLYLNGTLDQLACTFYHMGSRSVREAHKAK